MHCHTEPSRGTPRTGGIGGECANVAYISTAEHPLRLRRHRTAPLALAARQKPSGADLDSSSIWAFGFAWPILRSVLASRPLTNQQTHEDAWHIGVLVLHSCANVPALFPDAPGSCRFWMADSLPLLCFATISFTTWAVISSPCLSFLESGLERLRRGWRGEHARRGG